MAGKIAIFCAIFSGLDNLDHLTMNQNKIAHLGENFFVGVPKLTTLYLDHNKIATIHKNAFVGLEGEGKRLIILLLCKHLFYCQRRKMSQ